MTLTLIITIWILCGVGIYWLLETAGLTGDRFALLACVVMGPFAGAIVGLAAIIFYLSQFEIVIRRKK